MSEPAAVQVDLLEALRTTPARRYLADTPIPDAVLWELLDTAVRGPSGSNRQRWGWVVVTDPAVKAPIATRYRDGWEAAYGGVGPSSQPLAGTVPTPV